MYREALYTLLDIEEILDDSSDLSDSEKVEKALFFVESLLETVEGQIITNLGPKFYRDLIDSREPYFQ